jgi:hypothetical protein
MTFSAIAEPAQKSGRQSRHSARQARFGPPAVFLISRFIIIKSFLLGYVQINKPARLPAVLPLSGFGGAARDIARPPFGRAFQYFQQFGFPGI